MTDIHPSASTVTLELPNMPSVFPTFHISLVKPFLPNDDVEYPHREIDENQEFFVESVLNHRACGRGRQYLVKFQGYPDYYARWIAGKELEGDTALLDYLLTHPDLS